MAKKLSPEEQKRTKTDFDPPAIAKRDDSQKQDKTKKKGGKGNPNGRPKSANPRDKVINLKLTDEEKELLDEAAQMLKTSKTKVIAAGIEKVYTEAAARLWRQHWKQLKERMIQSEEEHPDFVEAEERFRAQLKTEWREDLLAAYNAGNYEEVLIQIASTLKYNGDIKAFLSELPDYHGDDISAREERAKLIDQLSKERQYKGMAYNPYRKDPDTVTVHIEGGGEE